MSLCFAKCFAQSLLISFCILVTFGKSGGQKRVRDSDRDAVSTVEALVSRGRGFGEIDAGQKSAHLGFNAIPHFYQLMSVLQ